MTGIEELRKVVALFSFCRESFNNQWHTGELIQLWRMYKESDCDVFPDMWTGRQIREALLGTPPSWDNNELPVYK